MIRLIFDVSTIYKIYYLDNFKLGKTFSVNPNTSFPIPLPIPNNQQNTPQKQIEGIEIDINCPQCGKHHKVNGYFNIDSSIIQKSNLKINQNIKENDILVCDSCNFALDLKPIKAQIENQTRKRLLFK